MKRLLPLLFIFIYTNAWCQSFDYLPAKVGNNQIISYTQFTLSYNEDHEQADWVAYELTKDEVQNNRDRCNCFEDDKAITSHSAEDSDYISTGFDRGHLAPSADNRMSTEANQESFLFSNMSPQLPSFNQGVWANLEAWVREKAVEYDTVYVVTGPVFINNLGEIGDNEVTIPGYFYKAILRFDDDKVRMTGFLFPHIGTKGNFKDYLVPINTIETLTGLDLFPSLGSRENWYESQEYESYWKPFD